MSKNDLIIETLAYMQDEEKDLLKQSGRSLGWVVDEGFNKETRAFVDFMNSLYLVYDDLKAKAEEENKKRQSDLIRALTEKSEGILSISKEDQEQFAKWMNGFPSAINIKLSEFDLYKNVKYKEQ